MEALKLKICHYLSCESHIHLVGVLRKTNTILDASWSGNMLQQRECECEVSAARWVSLLEVS